MKGLHFMNVRVNEKGLVYETFNFSNADGIVRRRDGRNCLDEVPVGELMRDIKGFALDFLTGLGYERNLVGVEVIPVEGLYKVIATV